MSYNTELQSNNSDLQAILDTINALPEAGESGIETCTVTITGSAAATHFYVKKIDNETARVATFGDDTTLTDVACGSMMTIRGAYLEHKVDNEECDTSYTAGLFCVYFPPSVSGKTINVTLVED